MNTNQTPELTWLGDVLKTASGLLEQIQTWPAALLLLVCLSLLGLVIYSLSSGLAQLAAKPDCPCVGFCKSSSLFFRHVAPISVILVGIFMNLYIGDYGRIAPDQRHAEIILGMWGFCIGFMAWMASWRLWRRFRKTLPLMNGGKDTTPPFPTDQSPSTPQPEE
jgi:hypothetical protein